MLLFLTIRILIFFSLIYCLKLFIYLIKRIIQAYKIIPEFIKMYKQQNLNNIKSIITLYYIQNILFILLSNYILFNIISKLNLFINFIYLYILILGLIGSYIFFIYYPLKNFNFYNNNNIKDYPIYIYLLLLLFIIFYMFIFPLIVINIINSEKFVLLKDLYFKKVINSNVYNNMFPNPNNNNLLIINSNSNNTDLEYNNIRNISLINSSNLNPHLIDINNNNNYDDNINNNNINNNIDIDNNNTNNNNTNNNNYKNNLNYLDKIFDVNKAIKKGTIYNNWYYLDKILNKEINYQTNRLFKLNDKNSIIFNNDKINDNYHSNSNDLQNIDQSKLDFNSSFLIYAQDQISNENNNTNINIINTNVNTNTNTNINNFNSSYDPNETLDLIGDDPFAANSNYYF